MNKVGLRAERRTTDHPTNQTPAINSVLFHKVEKEFPYKKKCFFCNTDLR